jgi:hypothetical protein
MRRVNQLAVQPEFYNTFTNNCTTNIVAHINHLAPGRVPYGFGVLLNGYSDRVAYRIGLLDTSVPFEELRNQANIGPIARAYGDGPGFSDVIRR